MASIHVNFRIKKEEKELIELINSQSNLSDFMRDLLKKEVSKKDIKKENDDLKKELDSVNLKLDTLQQSINMLTMILSSNSLQVQPVQQIQPQQPQQVEEVKKKSKVDTKDMDDEAFGNFDFTPNSN